MLNFNPSKIKRFIGSLIPRSARPAGLSRESQNRRSRFFFQKSNLDSAREYPVRLPARDRRADRLIQKIFLVKNVKKAHGNTTPFFSFGFSLIETIVAISIMILAIIGPMTTAQKGFTSAEYSKDQMKAYYLAEEALEYVHYIR